MSEKPKKSADKPKEKQPKIVKEVLEPILNTFKGDVEVIGTSSSEIVFKLLNRPIEVCDFIRDLDFDLLVWVSGKQAPAGIKVTYKSKKLNRKLALRKKRSRLTAF